MKEFDLSIQISDEALAAAMARAIAKEYPYVNVTVGETEDPDFILRDDFLSTPMPVREIMDRVLAASGKELIPERKPDSCPFTAFTSGGGGRGVTTCACFYAQTRAMEDARVLFLSFDPYLQPTDPQAGMELLHCAAGGARLPLRAACVADDTGLYVPAQSTDRNLLHELTAEDAAAFLESLEDSGEWDEVVLDVPRAVSYWKELMNMCERRILVGRGEGDPADADEAAYRELLALAQGDGENATVLLRFMPPYDESVPEGQRDPYGPLGCEVKKLAKQLADR